MVHPNSPNQRQKWPRLLGILIVAIACVFFGVRGYQDQQSALQSRDFKPIYAASRCMLAHCNPYDSRQTLAQFLAHGGDTSDLIPFSRFYLNYPPSSLFLVAPLALLSWPMAHALWLAILTAVFVAASAAMADLCLLWSPLLSLTALALFLVTSLLLIMLAQPATLAIGLCCLAVWTFVRNRYVPAGILCFALSLASKPHLGGLVFLYFLLANALYRKRAWQVLALTIILSLPGILWASTMPESKNWVHDLQSNISGMATAGSLSDPSPTNPEAGQLANLQAVAGLIHDDKPFKDHITWAICILLLLAWSYPVLRLRDSLAKDLLCLAAIAPIAMLPVYHRVYDTRLLLLTYPALALLLGTRKILGAFAFVLTLAVTVMTFSQLPNLHAIRSLQHAVLNHSGNWLIAAIFTRPVPTACLLTAIFYIACCYLFLSSSQSDRQKV